MKPNRLTCLGLGIAAGTAMHDGTLSLAIGAGLAASPWIGAALLHIAAAIRKYDHLAWHEMERWPRRPPSAHDDYLALKNACRCADCADRAFNKSSAFGLWQIAVNERDGYDEGIHKVHPDEYFLDPFKPEYTDISRP